MELTEFHLIILQHVFLSVLNHDQKAAYCSGWRDGSIADSICSSDRRLRLSSQHLHQAALTTVPSPKIHHSFLDSLKAPGMHVVDTHTEAWACAIEINLRKYSILPWNTYVSLGGFSSLNCFYLYKYKSSPSCSFLPNMGDSSFHHLPHNHQQQIKLLFPLALLSETNTSHRHRALLFHIRTTPES